MKKLLIHGFEIEVEGDPKDYYFRVLAEYNHHGLLSLVESCMAEGHDYLDVGANIGVTSIAAAKIFPDCRVYGFEPSPSTFGFLARNVAHNRCPNVRPLPLALGSALGVERFEESPNSAQRHLGGTGSEGSPLVKVTTLDEFAQTEALNPGFIKIDTEGFELEVLEGAKGLIESCPATPFHLEFNAYALSANRATLPAEALTALRRLFSHLYYLDPRFRLVPIDDDISARRFLFDTMYRRGCVRDLVCLGTDIREVFQGRHPREEWWRVNLDPGTAPALAPRPRDPGHPPRLLGTNLLREFRDAARELKRRLHGTGWAGVNLWGGGETGELLSALLSSINVGVEGVYDGEFGGEVANMEVQSPSAGLVPGLPLVVGAKGSEVVEAERVSTGEFAPGERTYSEFKDIHKGRRCFILGSDRTLEKVDLAPLAGEVTLGSTLILDRLSREGLPLSYWTVENQIYARDTREKWDNLKGPVRFLPRDLKYLAGNLENVALVDLLRHSFGAAGPSFNPHSQAIFAGGFVTFLELQLAFHLGCDPIYLLGADYYFPRPADSGPLDFKPIRAGLENALAYAKAVGVRIEVAAPAQALEVFPSVEYAGLF